MNELEIKDVIEQLSNNLFTISEYKKYWLIRTQSGSLYDLFIDYKIVGLDHSEIKLSEINDICNENNKKESLEKLKQKLSNYYDKFDLDDDITPRKLGLIAGQVYKFYKELKKGDIVIIPSTNSEIISFGEITEGLIAELKPEEKRVFDYDYPLLKRVKWIKEIRRDRLDPYLYKMFTNHQAICDISSYAEVIERSLNDLFVINDEAHNVIRVEAEVVKAKDLFGLGFELLDLVDEFCNHYNISDVSSDDFEVSVNINSPGNVDLKSKTKKGILIASLIIATMGGGLEYGDFSIKTNGIPGLITSISQFLDDRSQRIISENQAVTNDAMKKDIWNKYKNSLKIKDPEELKDFLKQFDKNQDLPK
ncbi:hypothetical protein SAMN05443634_105215 [Chishuiella changwenlii]|uniref:Uncharacterized protein n=1 Tax=Chishuiella changwenlii TaxID=1434701 RepID=A0A1M6XDW1_9FLAO|nr:hypothetical protein [Chishuiella changwenlii]GGF00524.1 hypothetical protein GCM10010984_17670 [Chishuiella changwenlii]SHL04200.1 hypothetical protein SAMN05443634_105215 [Chishuiella changwenlii]